MSVFFRTGDHTAASVSWPVYIFVVLPFQMLYLAGKVLVYAAVWTMAGVMVAARWTRGRWVAHKERRPPAA